MSKSIEIVDLQLGKRNRYWRKDVTICQGSKCMKDDIKYRP